MSELFLDSSFQIALIWPGDRHRVRALAMVDEIRDAQLVLTEGVLNEVIARLARRSAEVRRESVVFVREALQSSGRYRLIETTPDHIHRAVSICESRLEDRLSLVDAVAMAVMEDLGITEILTFDGDFAKSGEFTVLPPPISD